MHTPKFTKDIMVTDLISCDPRASLSDARSLMKEYSIRHVPVVDTVTHEFKGVISQKSLLKEAFNIANKFGMGDLDHQEGKRNIEDFLCADIQTATAEMPLIEAGAFFMASKHGCLPILEGTKIVGIITSADFVKLSMTLLEA